MQTQAVEPGSLTRYLIWSLRSHFVVVLLSELLAFWALTSIFALCIYAGAQYQPQCLVFPDGGNFEENGSYFLDAFAVSWTTFATVVRLGQFFLWTLPANILLRFIVGWDLPVRDMEWLILKFGESTTKRLFIALL